MLADALGRPLRFIITAGQVGDVTQAPTLLEGQAGNALLADKAYDSNALRAIIADMGTEAVIPSNRTRKIAISHDAIAYKQRNRIERCFNRLKHFRRFATRYERRTILFAGFVCLAAIMIWCDKCRSALGLSRSAKGKFCYNVHVARRAVRAARNAGLRTFLARKLRSSDRLLPIKSALQSPSPISHPALKARQHHGL